MEPKDMVKIKGYLENLSSKIDWISDTNLRRYLDAQIVCIYRTISGMETDSIEAEAKEYLAKLNEGWS